jgi:hypothetical protein
MPNTPNMDLAQSTPLVTGGPLWAQRIEDNLILIDQHDHSTGKGTPITPAGLNINSDLSMGDFSLLDIETANFVSQAAPLSGITRLYVSGGDLYYNNGAGTPVRVTAGVAVNVSGVGGITGLGATTAAVTYSDLTKTFSFTQDANNAASLICGDVTIAEPGIVSPSSIRLRSPSALAGSYDITLFPAPPASKKYVQIDGAGVLTATDALDNVTLESVLGVMRITDLGVSTAKLADLAVTNPKLAQMPAVSVKANATASTATPTDLAASANGVLLERGGTLQFTSIQTANIQDGQVTAIKLSAQPTSTGAGATGNRGVPNPGVADISVTHTVQNAARAIRIMPVSAGGANGITLQATSPAIINRVARVEYYSGATQIGGAVDIALTSNFNLASISVPSESVGITIPGGTLAPGLQTFSARFSLVTGPGLVFWTSVALRVIEL